MQILGYRKVPVNTNNIGETALTVEPEIEQVFIAAPDHLNNADSFDVNYLCYVIMQLISFTIQLKKCSWFLYCITEL